MKINNTTWWILGGAAVALGGGAAVYFLVIRNKSKSDKFGNQVIRKNRSGGIAGGVSTSTGNRGTKLIEPNWNNPFDMNYEEDVKRWVSPKRIRTLNPSDALQMAETLHKAKGSGWWSDDDEQAVGEIFQKRIRDKVQVANLSRAFWKKYQKDMWEYLNGFLGTSEMERYVQKPVKNLPKYQLA